jgi:hypothetical protein
MVLMRLIVSLMRVIASTAPLEAASPHAVHSVAKRAA